MNRPSACLTLRMLGRVDQDDAILVEQPLVALDHDLVVALVLEADPGGAVGQRIGAHAHRGIQRGPMPEPSPGASHAVGCGVDSGGSTG